MSKISREKMEKTRICLRLPAASIKKEMGEER